jgi:hypothetical protein
MVSTSAGPVSVSYPYTQSPPFQVPGGGYFIAYGTKATNVNVTGVTLYRADNGNSTNFGITGGDSTHWSATINTSWTGTDLYLTVQANITLGGASVPISATTGPFQC